MKLKKGWVWPLVPVFVLGFSVCMHVTMFAKAAADPTIAVEKDAYRRGIRWDEELRQRSVNRALGWTVAIDVDADAIVTARIARPDGTPVAGATVEVELFHHARASRIVTTTMRPTDDGAYQVELPYRKRGFWRMHFDVTLGDLRFTDTVNHFVRRRFAPVTAR